MRLRQKLVDDIAVNRQPVQETLKQSNQLMERGATDLSQDQKLELQALANDVESLLETVRATYVCVM